MQVSKSEASTPAGLRREPKGPVGAQNEPMRLAADQLVLTRTVDPRMGEIPQASYGVRLSPRMQRHAADLDRFVADTGAKIDLLADRLKQDPEYQRVAAPGVWQRLSTKQRVAFADHVARLQGEVLGFTPAKTHVTHDPDRSTDGGFDDETGRLEINSNSDVFDNLPQFLNTVVHEQFHCYQRFLTRRRFPRTDPRHAASEVYKLDAKEYHEAPEDSKKRPAQYAAYRMQPSEAHAFMMGQRFFKRLFGDG